MLLCCAACSRSDPSRFVLSSLSTLQDAAPHLDFQLKITPWEAEDDDDAGLGGAGSGSGAGAEGDFGATTAGSVADLKTEQQAAQAATRAAQPLVVVGSLVQVTGRGGGGDTVVLLEVVV